MGALCRNAFALLRDEEGEVEASKLTEKIMKIQEENQKKLLLPSWNSIEFCYHEASNDDAGEGDIDEWTVLESRRQRADGGGKEGGAVGGSAGTTEKKEAVVKEEEDDEEEEGYEELTVEETTKGQLRRRRFLTWTRRETAAIRKLDAKLRRP